MQATRKYPFIRPDVVDPAVHDQNVSDHLTYITGCCHRAALLNQPPETKQNLWGKLVKLTNHNHMRPAEARSHQASSSTTDLPDIAVTGVAESESGSSLCIYLPDLKSDCDITDYNENMIRKREPHQGLSKPPATKQSVLFPVLDADAGDSDFDPRSSAGFGELASRKPLASRGRNKGLTVEGRGGKVQKGSWGRAAAAGGKKDEVGGNESKRLRKPRKAKETANSQMKLVLTGAGVQSLDSDNASAADDIYAVTFSSAEEATTSYASYRSWKQKQKTIGEGNGNIPPPLAQRVGLHESRASRLFDDMMMKEQAKAPLRAETDHELSAIAETAASKVIESVPRYFCQYFYYCVTVTAFMICFDAICCGPEHRHSQVESVVLGNLEAYSCLVFFVFVFFLCLLCFFINTCDCNPGIDLSVNLSYFFAFGLGLQICHSLVSF